MRLLAPKKLYRCRRLGVQDGGVVLCWHRRCAILAWLDNLDRRAEEDEFGEHEGMGGLR